MREQVIASLALLCFLLSPFQAIGQDKDSSDKAWPSLGGDEKIINKDQPGFIIDPQKLDLAQNVSNPLSVTRCLPSSEPCVVLHSVSYFFSELKGIAPFLIEKSILRPDVMMRHYPDALVGDGSLWLHHRYTGTYVFYLPRQNVFYLWGDCGMNHSDEVRGPFAGDPRLVLKKLAGEPAVK
jgi:hypothetical protein